MKTRIELINAREAAEAFELYTAEGKPGIYEDILDGKLLAKEFVLQTINGLPPEVKQTLLDCLRKKKVPFLAFSEDGGSKNWYTKFVESTLVWPNAVGRRLLQNLTPASAPSTFSTAPSPSVGPSAFGMTPSPSPAPSSSQVSVFPPSPQSPEPSFFSPDFSSPTLQPTAGGDPSSTPDTAVTSDKKNNSSKSVVVAVVVTATVTFAAVAMFFCCYTRICRTGSGGRWNDERPLLNLSMSDYSVGSSRKPFGLWNSVSTGKNDNPSFNVNSSHGNFSIGSNMHGSTKADIQPLGVVADVAKIPAEDSAVVASPLKPPPGRLVDPPVMPTLKPPPGRMDSSLPPAPSLGKATPPPVPAPPLKPPSGSRPPPPPGPPPPIPSGIKTGPRPPPPPKSSLAPPRPPAMGLKPQPPGANRPNASSGAVEADAPKAKLKPFFWDKVLANPDHSMVWHQIKSGSFQFNEEMIESLFGYAAPAKNKDEPKKESSSQDPSIQYVQIIDSKKSQNLSILLRAWNVTTEEVHDALLEGNELPSELLQTLLKMAPTTEEELKLRLYSGELSRLGPADRFLKILADIPFAFKRLESLLFMCTLQEETTMVKEAFAVLESACTELRKSRLFLKLLEAVLKTGNRMNDGTFRGGAQAFKLDTLLKLSDVKGTDGKTTLLHFVVQEIIRSEGIRAARAAGQGQSMSSIKSNDILEDASHDSEEHYCSLGLQVVSGLGSELENVRKAAALDADSLTGSVAKLGSQLMKARDFLNSDMKNAAEDNGFLLALTSFVQNAEVDVMSLLEDEKRIMALVKSTADYFHGNAGKDEGLRLFVIVRDFLIMLNKACKDVKDAPRKPNRNNPRREGPAEEKPSSETRQPPDPLQRLFPAITDRRVDSSSSDDDA